MQRRLRRRSPSSRPSGATSSSARAVGDDAIEFQRHVDLRYVGQSYELTIPAGDGLLERFHEEHDRTYGFAAPTEPVEVVSLRLTSVGRIAKPPPRQLDRGGEVEPKEHRQVFFAESGGYVDCPIYDRYALPAGAAFPGPAVVEEFDSTTVVHPGFRLQVDDTGNLLIERRSMTSSATGGGRGGTGRFPRGSAPLHSSGVRGGGSRGKPGFPRATEPKAKEDVSYGIAVAKDVMVRTRTASASRPTSTAPPSTASSSRASASRRSSAARRTTRPTSATSRSPTSSSRTATPSASRTAATATGRRAPATTSTPSRRSRARTATTRSSGSPSSAGRTAAWARSARRTRRSRRCGWRSSGRRI